MNNNELVTAIRNRIAEYRKDDASLRIEFEEAKKSGNKEETVRIYNAIIENNQVILIAQQDLVNLIHGKVDEETLKSLNEKYNSEIVLPNPIAEDEIENEEPTKVEKSNKGLGAAILALLGFGAVGAVGYAIGSNEKAADYEESNDNTQTPVPTEEVKDLPLQTVAPEVTDVPEVTVTPEVTPSLTLGEVGTFTDITNDEQVNARAQFIYDNYYKSYINDLSENTQSGVSVELIANCIRVMNGELPLDENGNKVFDINIVDDYSGKYVNLLTNIPSSAEKDGWLYTPAYLFTTDGTDLQKFIKSYDDLYAQVVDGLNKQDATIARPAIEQIGHKFNNEWILDGMYGDVNPHTFDSKNKLFAFWSTIFPYGTTVVEYNIDSMQPVCIEACVDYETKLMKEVPVTELYYGILTGEYNEVVGRLTGIDVPNIPDSVGFTQDLLDILQYKYEHLDTMKLTK